MIGDLFLSHAIKSHSVTYIHGKRRNTLFYMFHTVVIVVALVVLLCVVLCVVCLCDLFPCKVENKDLNISGAKRQIPPCRLISKASATSVTQKSNIR